MMTRLDGPIERAIDHPRYRGACDFVDGEGREAARARLVAGRVRLLESRVLACDALTRYYMNGNRPRSVSWWRWATGRGR
jgi:hypothetical protein